MVQKEFPTVLNTVPSKASQGMFQNLCNIGGVCFAHVLTIDCPNQPRLAPRSPTPNLAIIDWIRIIPVWGTQRTFPKNLEWALQEEVGVPVSLRL